MRWLGRPRPGGSGGQGASDAAARLRAELQRQERDRELLEGGRLPSAAYERLQRVGAGSGQLAFTGDLAPDEAALLRGGGLRPLALVTGSCVYHVGIAYASAYGDCEVPQLSAAYNEATRLATARLRQEAAALGAHGVVGVRYGIVRHEWADQTVEVQLVGTAVRAEGPPPGAPWLCDLSGQEWWALHRAGYEPAALAWGHCTWFVLTTPADAWNESSPRNAELEHFSQALAQCRLRAVRHVLEVAREAGALGVVGVHVSRRLDEVELADDGSGNPVFLYKHHNLVLSLIGTALRVRADARRAVPATRLVLPLRGTRLRSRVAAAAAAFR